MTGALYCGSFSKSAQLASARSAEEGDRGEKDRFDGRRAGRDVMAEEARARARGSSCGFSARPRARRFSRMHTRNSRMHIYICIGEPVLHRSRCASSFFFSSFKSLLLPCAPRFPSNPPLRLPPRGSLDGASPGRPPRAFFPSFFPVAHTRAPGLKGRAANKLRDRAALHARGQIDGELSWSPSPPPLDMPHYMHYVAGTLLSPRFSPVRDGAGKPGIFSICERGSRSARRREGSRSCSRSFWRFI